MKKSILMGLGVCALALGGIAALGGQRFLEVNAVPEGKSNMVIHHGTGESWSDDWFTYVGGNDSDGWTYTVNVTLAQGEQFGIKDWEHGIEWMTFYDSSRITQGIELVSSNLVCRLAGNYDVTYWYKDGSNKQLIGFELSEYKNAYLYASDEDWKASGKAYIHAWKEGPVDLTDWYNSCPINEVGEVTIDGGTYKFYWAKLPANAIGYKFKAYNNNTDYALPDQASFGVGLKLTGNKSCAAFPEGKVIGDIVSNMGSAEYEGTSYAKSICATSYVTAQSIISDYESIADKTLINAATITTYDVVNGGTKAVAIPDIIESLKTIPSGGGALSAVAMESNDSVFPISLIAISAGIMCVAGAFAIRRTKKEE